MGCNASTATLTKNSIERNPRISSNGKDGGIYVVKDTETQPNEILTKRQKGLITKSWKSLSGKQVQHARSIFLRIFEQDPTLKTLFSFDGLEGEALTKNPSFQAHALSFIQIIQSAMDSLDDLEHQLVPIILNLGKFHQRLKGVIFSPEYFQTFIDSMLYVWSVELQATFTVETEQAWTILLDFIVVYLKKGYKNDLASNQDT